MGVYFGISTGMWQLAVMSGLSAVIAIGLKLKPKPDAEFTLQIRARGVLVNGRKVRRPYRLWPNDWRDEYRVQLEQLLAQFDRSLTKTRFDSLSFVAGYGVELNLEVDGPHLFLVGPTGSGKSKFLELSLSSISGEPRLLLVDYKGGATLSGFGDCLTDLDDPIERERFWVGLQELLTERERYLALHRVSTTMFTALEPVLVVVDELAHVLREDRQSLAALSAVAARGRSLGVYLICASQSVSGVPRELLVNLSLRIVLAGIDEVDALQLGAKKRPAKIAGIGSGLIVGGPEFRFPFRPEPLLVSQRSDRVP